MSFQIQPPSWAEIIEAPLAQLLEWQRNGTSHFDLDSQIYLDLMVAYLKNDQSEFRRTWSKLNATSPLFPIARLRFEVCNQTMTIALIDQCVRDVESRTNDISYYCEIYFIAGYACYTLHNFEKAIFYYKKALPGLTKIEAYKKALKCSQNILASNQELNPHMKLIPEYQAIYREARRLKDHATCGLTQMNISREYQKIGALSIALESIQLALTFYQKDFGTLDYFLCLAHRAHLYLQLGLEEHALRDIEMCMTSDFPKIHQVVKVLEKIDFQADEESQTHLLNPTWTKRARQYKREKETTVFNGLEERLLSLLRSGPRTKSELIEQLYGSLIDHESADNRFKNLLVRVRKKSQGLIGHKDSHYFLLDTKKQIG